MKDLLSSLFSFQAPPEGVREGLPYWAFWFLICIILLLVILIFLRDKDLRKRVNAFFYGIKKKLKKMRLQVILKRIKQKRDVLIGELGKKVWENDIKVEHGEDIQSKLEDLESQRKKKLEELEKVQSELNILQFNLQKEKKI